MKIICMSGWEGVKMKRQIIVLVFNFLGEVVGRVRPKMGFYNCICFREHGYKRTQARPEMHSLKKLSHTQDWKGKAQSWQLTKLQVL